MVTSLPLSGLGRALSPLSGLGKDLLRSLGLVEEVTTTVRSGGRYLVTI